MCNGYHYFRDDLHFKDDWCMRSPSVIRHASNRKRSRRDRFHVLVIVMARVIQIEARPAYPESALVNPQDELSPSLSSTTTVIIIILSY